VVITPGVGATIAADDVSSVFYQRIKLDGGGDGVAAPILGDSTNGLDVDVTRVGAGENFIGAVGGKVALISASITRPSDTTAYAAGDAATNSTTAPVVSTFTGAARVAAGSGTIVAATLIDSANQATKGNFELWLFDTTATPDNDNAVFTPTDAECLTLVGVIPFGAAIVGDATSGAGGNAVYPVQGLGMPFKLPSGSDLFGLLVVRNAYTPVSAEVFTMRLHILQD
jgi:hypothetical protein